MDKEKDLILRRKGYIPVEEYVAEKIIGKCQPTEFQREDFEEQIQAVRLYEELSEQFHQPGGDGYYIVQRCLQKYLDCKFIQKNNRFRFDVFEEKEKQEEYQYIARKRPKKPLVGTQADIYYLLFEADQQSAASRKCREYVASNKLQLTSVLISLIEQAVENLEADENIKLREYGRILRTAYMKPETAALEASALYQILGYTKKQYYTHRNHGITLVSEYLFGFFAGEAGLAELYLNGKEIIAPSIKR